MQLYPLAIVVSLILLVPVVSLAGTPSGLDNITLNAASLSNTTLTVDLSVSNDEATVHDTQYIALYLCDEQGNTKEARFVSWTLAFLLAPGESNDMVLEAPLPPGLEPGLYYVYAVTSPTDTFPGSKPGIMYDAKPVQIYDYTKNIPLLTGGYSVRARQTDSGSEPQFAITNVSIQDNKRQFIPGEEIAITVILTRRGSTGSDREIPITTWLGNYALIPKNAIVSVPDTDEPVSDTLTYQIPDALMPGEYTLATAPGTSGSDTSSLTKTLPLLLYRPSERPVPAYCGADALNYKMISVTAVS